VTLRVAPGAVSPQSPPPAPGQPSAAEVARALLGVAGMTIVPAMVELLDQQGNQNGVLDIGDLRAYLRIQGHLP
jgi:hypothetical protein